VSRVSGILKINSFFSHLFFSHFLIFYNFSYFVKIYLKVNVDVTATRATAYTYKSKQRKLFFLFRSLYIS